MATAPVFRPGAGDAERLHRAVRYGAQHSGVSGRHHVQQCHQGGCQRDIRRASAGRRAGRVFRREHPNAEHLVEMALENILQMPLEERQARFDLTDRVGANLKKSPLAK